jgi:hypothetical protein
MYQALPQFDRKDLRRIFISLKHLRYVVRTNPRAGAAATFCISQKGRDLLKTQYGIDLEDGETAE